MHEGQVHESSPSVAASFAGDCGGGAAAGGAAGDAGGATGEEGAGAGAAPTSLSSIKMLDGNEFGYIVDYRGSDGAYRIVFDDIKDAEDAYYWYERGVDFEVV